MSDPLFFDIIPKKIPILGIDCEILKQKQTHFGYYDYNTHRIELKWKMGDYVAKSTLLHEIFHGGLRKSGLHYKLNDEDLEEAIAQMIETLFLPLLDFKFEANRKK